MTAYIAIGAVLGIVLAVVALWLGERGAWADRPAGLRALPRRRRQLGRGRGDGGDVPCPPERTEECPCGADVPISAAHIVAGDVEQHPEAGGASAVSMTYCAEHCPGGCVNQHHPDPAVTPEA